MKRDNLLMVAESEHDADMLYAVGMFVPDPFIYLQLHGKCHVVMNDLEIDRARKQAAHCQILSLADYQLKASRKLKPGDAPPGFAEVIRQILREERVSKVVVPYNFPLGLATQLQALKVRIQVRSGPLFPERELKTADEVKKISAALMMAEVGLAEGIQVLRRAKIHKDGRILHNGIPLTSERLRAVIDTAIIQAGGLAHHTIVAGGKQGCDPHEQGHGMLRAHQPIILDVFPRSQKTGYYGDITRTVVKGRASDIVRKIYHTVARGQELAFSMLGHNVSGQELHEAVQQFFSREGFQTGPQNGRMQGFFHGTGHGVGLELHETPNIGAASRDFLKAGHVVTVEPGLYYSPLGGVRLEDVAYIQQHGARNLTKFEKVLEL